VTEAVIVSTARTGLGKSWKGAFNMTYGATLGAHSVRHAVERAGIDPAEVEDVIMGSTFGEGTTGGNIARAIALRAGLPTSTAGLSINRFCSSGLQAIALADHDRGRNSDGRRRRREHFVRAERSEHAYAPRSVVDRA
jgi:acetyl-CoA C-acetyltransferase